MSGCMLYGLCVGVLMTATILHWLYQRAADKWEQRMGDEIGVLSAEVERLRLTDAERALLERLSTNTREYDPVSSGRPWFVTVDDADIIRGLIARLDKKQEPT